MLHIIPLLSYWFSVSPTKTEVPQEQELCLILFISVTSSYYDAWHIFTLNKHLFNEFPGSSWGITLYFPHKHGTVSGGLNNKALWFGPHFPLAAALTTKCDLNRAKGNHWIQTIKSSQKTLSLYNHRLC